MTQENDNLCVFCGTIAPSSSANDSEVVNQFIWQVCGSKESPLKVRVCTNCLSEVAKAVEWREQVGDMERDVRSLQRIILKMMHQLQSLQGNYLEEMMQLQRKIQSSENLFVTEESRQRRPKKNSTKVSTIRRGVVNVVMGLRAFRNEVQQEEINDDFVELESIPPTTHELEIVNTHRKTSPHQNLDEMEETVVKNEEQDPLSQDETILPDSSPPDAEESIDVDYFIYSEVPVNSEALPLEAEAVADDDNPEITSRSPKKKRSIPKEKGKVPVPRTTTSDGEVRFGPCRFCGKTFATAQILTWHENTHTGERPYKCHLCPKAFAQPGNLSTHLLHHSGRKHFKCLYCSKGFPRKYDMERHQRKHTGEKPFSCQVCGSRFASRQNVKNHILARHPTVVTDS